MNSKEIYSEAIALAKDEKNAWEQGSVFVTDKVVFNMRNLIRQCRKNYWGVFDKPKDPVTGRKKVWVPLTESVVESVVKNVDIDTKDINVRSKKIAEPGLAQVVRSGIKNNLDEIYFGEYLDEMERISSIDGTCVWKTLEKKVDSKPSFDIRVVDLLNFYIDPLARSIQETPAVIERCVMTVKELQSYDGWDNVKEVEGEKNLHPGDGESKDKSTARGETRLIDVWERWGLMPEYFITGDPKDTSLIEGHIVYSDLDGVARVHLIEKNIKGIKPYEEFWRKRVPGRWYGRGDAECLIMLQLWLNITVNLRINKNYIESLGLFKIRKGAGITAQMLSKLASQGVVQVENMQDIEQMVVQSASSTAYQDVEDIRSWSERVTQAFEAVTGEQLPSSTTATVGAIQSRSAMSAFTLVKEGYGMALQRWLKRHAIPILQKRLTRGEIIRTTGDPEDMRAFDKLLATNLVLKEGGDMLDFEKKVNEKIVSLSQLGNDRFITLAEDINLSDYDTEVFVTNEEFDSSVVVQNLISMLQVAPEQRESIISQAFDLMGLRYKPSTVSGGMSGITAPQNVNSMVDQLQMANQPQQI